MPTLLLDVVLPPTLLHHQHEHVEIGGCEHDLAHERLARVLVALGGFAELRVEGFGTTTFPLNVVLEQPFIKLLELLVERRVLEGVLIIL